VNTEVLLLARAPSIDDRRQIVHVDDTVVINVGIWIIAPHVLLMSSLGSPFAAY
jgi:hypothetical protein